MYRHIATAELLIAKGADVQAKDMVKCLKIEGASKAAVNRTILDVALCDIYLKVIVLFLVRVMCCCGMVGMVASNASIV
jgi:hypothetical protein